MTFDRRRALLLVISGAAGSGTFGLSLFGSTAGSLASSPSGPVSLIQSLNTELGDLATRADGMPLNDRLTEVADLLERYFDLFRVAAGTIGSRRFRDLESGQQQQFVDRFTTFIVASYVHRLPRFRAERTEVEEARDGPPGFKVVRTYYHSDNGADPTVIDFITMENAATWRIVDMRMDGEFSEFSLRRSEVSSILERDGFDGLIALLEQRAEELVME